MLNLQQWIKFSSSTRIYVNPTGSKLVFYLQGKSWELIFRRNSAGTPTPACPTVDLSCLQRSWELIFRRNSAGT